MVNLHVCTKDTKIWIENQTIWIEKPEQRYFYELGMVNYIFIHAGVMVSSDLMRKAFDRGIEIIFCRENGYPIASLFGPMYGSRAFLCFNQLQLVGTPICLSLAADWLRQKFLRRKDFLLKICDKKSAKFIKYLNAVSILQDQIIDYQYIFNHEAIWDKIYYACLNDAVPKAFRFKRSERRKLGNLGNAVLNYLYGMMYLVLERLIVKFKMDPFIGFHHGMAKGKKAFLFDVMELFRPICEELFINYSNNFKCLPHLPNGLLDLNTRRELIDLFNSKIYKSKRPIFNAISNQIKLISTQIRHELCTI